MLQFFVFRLRNVVTSNFVVQLLKAKGLYFSVVLHARSKENTKILSGFKICVQLLYIHFLQKMEQITDILLIL